MKAPQRTSLRTEVMWFFAIMTLFVVGGTGGLWWLLAQLQPI